MFVVEDEKIFEDVMSEMSEEGHPAQYQGQGGPKSGLKRIFASLRKFFGKKKNFQLKTNPASLADYRGLDIQRI
jgi:hypothetical protein